jgi:hypothetical protein
MKVRQPVGMPAGVKYKPVFISHVETPAEIYFQSVSTEDRMKLEK